MPDTIIRTCPNCAARYKIVRVNAGPPDTFREITCKSCGGPLPAREGASILKYFLVSARKKRIRA
jgi:hypothetical protein